MLRRTLLRTAKKAIEKTGDKAPVVGSAALPKFLSNADVGGKSTYEIQKDMTEKEIKAWETEWIQKNLPVQNQQALNAYYTATQAPGWNGGSWRFDQCWAWNQEHRYAPWYTQQYLIGAGRNPGGYPFWGVVEWMKINVYEGWRIRRNFYKLWTWTAVTMFFVNYRDYIWDPYKEAGIEGQIQRRREGKWINSYGMPGIIWMFIPTPFFSAGLGHLGSGW